MYKIYALDDTISYVYIGHTKNFIHRKAQHKLDCKTKSLPVYNFIKNNGGWEMFKMMPIEEYKCNTLMEAKIREQYWIDNHKNLLNKNATIGNKPEWFINHKEEKKEYDLKYRNINKEKIKERDRLYYLKKKEEQNNITVGKLRFPYDPFLFI
jgi:hypothetical protein